MNLRSDEGTLYLKEYQGSVMSSMLLSPLCRRSSQSPPVKTSRLSLVSIHWPAIDARSLFISAALSSFQNRPCLVLFFTKTVKSLYVPSLA